MAKQVSKRRLPASPFKSPAVSAGDAASSVLQDVFSSRGFGTHQIVSNWQAIVGDELAEMTAPEKLSWTNPPPGHHGENGQTAILHLRVEGPVALEIQHMAGQIIERINIYLGAPLIQSLRILQAPLARTAAPIRKHAEPIPAKQESCSDEDSEQDDPLDAALARLEAAIGEK